MPYGFDKDQVKLTDEGQRVLKGGAPRDPGYSPPYTQQEAAERMPNYEKLTRAERWVFEALPAVGDGVNWVKGKMERSWLGSKALDAAGWAGKALNVLDVGAEGLERTLGFAIQYGAALDADDTGTSMQEFKSSLGDAWYAGSLFADASALPKFTGVKEDGTWAGIQIPTAADGAAQVQAMLQAQRRIGELVETEGMKRGDALKIAKAEYYDSLGALSFRAQLHDTILHIAADPLNYILPALSPVDAMYVRRAKALSTVPAETVQDLSKWDQFVVAFTGGTVASPSLASKIPLVGKAFEVTPASRASEFLSTVADNVDSYILSRMDDPVEIVETIMRANKGALGDDFGHALVTLEGRTVQGVLSASEIKAKEMLGTWEFLTPHRAFLDDAAEVLGESPAKIVGYLSDETQAAALMRRLQETGYDLARVDKTVITEIAKFGDDVPYTADLFKHYLKNAITDVAAQQAVLQFGVKARGMVQKMSYALKSAETLAFLRINPGFAVKNFVNNEFTMLARGVGGFAPQSAIDDLVEVLGFSPHRMSQAFTMAGDSSIEGAKILGSSEKLIAEALRGEPGFLGKAFDAFTDYANKIQIGPEIKGARPFDMGYWASKAEAAASKRAFYNGYTQGWRKFWQPGKGFTQARDGLRTVTDERFLDDIDDFVGAARSEKELDAFMRGEQRAAGAVMKQVERELGTPLDQVFDSVQLADLETKLTEAMSKGPAAIRRTLGEFRDKFNGHLDELAQANNAARVDEIASVVQAGGPNGLLLKWGDAIDDLAGAHLSHNFRMSLLERPNAMFADEFWNRVFTNSDEFWKRTWGRFDETIEGMERGAKNIGMELPKDVKTGYRQIQTETRKFFDMRKKLRAEYIAARRANKTPAMSWEQIDAQLDEAYGMLIETERIATQNIDDVVTDMVRQSQPEVAEAFAAWRAKARELVLQDKQATSEFMKRTHAFLPEERATQYNLFHNERFNRYVEMWKNERAGISMMGGQPARQMSFEQMRPGFVPTQEAAQQVRQLARQYGIVDKAGDPVFQRLTNTVNKYLRGEYADEVIEAAAKALPEDIPEDVMRLWEANIRYRDAAKEARKLAKEKGYGEGFTLQRLKEAEASAQGTGRQLSAKLKELGLTREDIKRMLEKAPQEAATPTAQQFTRIEEIPPNMIQEALEARRVSRGEEVLELVPPKVPDYPTVTDPRIVTKDMDAMQPPYWAQDQNMMQSGWNALDELERAALDNNVKPPLKWDSLAPEQAAEVERYISGVKGEMADSRYASIRYGEYKRDSALLNYNRRYNYNTALGVLAPFEFWTTQSVMKWAIHSIDRPAMLSTYLRMKKFITQAGAPNQGFPTRLQNSIRIPAPFMPDWMGNKGIYIDPLRFALPFDNFMMLPEQMVKDQHNLDNRTVRYLQEQIANGAISSEEGLKAINDRAGGTWEQALAVTKSMDDNGQTDAFDMMNLFTSVHAPIQWAWKAATGEKDEIGPLFPFRRNIKQTLGLFGIDPAQKKYGIWGNIRKSMGLPAYDQWDDYRIERTISSMIATQQITPDQGMRAMIEKEGEVWEQAASQAAKEFSGGSVGGYLLKQLGIPVQTYPEGELIQRSLQDDFSRAYEAYKDGNVEALTGFFDKHPEYESRLALWDTPEERMQQFLVDEIWSRYHDMPTVHKNQLRDNFGPMWETLFLNKETRNTKSVPTETLQVWLKLMGGDPPGTLSGPAIPIDFAPSEEAWRVEQFYTLRKSLFPDYNKMQDEYFKLDESARRGYRQQNPALTDYWDWRNDFLHRNPDVAGYVTDDYEFKYKDVEDYRQAQEAQPQLSFNEWSMALGPSVARVLQDKDIPAEAEEYLENYAEQLGMTLEELVEAVANSR